MGLKTTKRKYFTLYRRASSGPDIVEAYNITENMAEYFKAFHSDVYRVVEQEGLIDW